LLNSAPELIDRIQRLTERLTELLSDKNQNAISDILENIDKTTKVLAERAPDLGDAIGDSDRARNAGIAAQQRRRAHRQHQPAGHRAGQAGGRGPAQGDRLGPAGGRQSRRDDFRRPARRPELQQVDAAGSQPSWSATCASCRNRSGRSERVEPAGDRRRARAEKLPDYKPGKRK
jgi:phospholipid/cholesterol/gamma-HCH transport system substrate-binding protein